MGAFDWFWKAMGSQSERNDKKSKAIVGSADEAARALGQQDDAAVAQAARDAVKGGEVADKAPRVKCVECCSARGIVGGWGGLDELIEERGELWHDSKVQEHGFDFEEFPQARKSRN